MLGAVKPLCHRLTAAALIGRGVLQPSQIQRCHCHGNHCPRQGTLCSLSPCCRSSASANNICRMLPIWERNAASVAGAGCVNQFQTFQTTVVSYLLQLISCLLVCFICIYIWSLHLTIASGQNYLKDYVTKNPIEGEVLLIIPKQGWSPKTAKKPFIKGWGNTICWYKYIRVLK